MRVKDVYPQNRRLWVRLREKGGKAHALPCHHALEDYLVAYLDGNGLRDDSKGPLFRTIGSGRSAVRPAAAAGDAGQRPPWCAGGPLPPASPPRSAATASAPPASPPTWPTAGGTLETAAAMANHASTRTTQLYDRRGDRVNLDEVERIRL